MTEKATSAASSLAIRGLGVAIIGIALAVYRDTLPGITTDLLLPIAFAVGTWLVIKNLAAVCLGSALLAFAHSEPSSADWIASIAYPVIAVSCLATTIGIYGIRFKKHVGDTHDERWRSRR